MSNAFVAWALANAFFCGIDCANKRQSALIHGAGAIAWAVLAAVWRPENL